MAPFVLAKSTSLYHAGRLWYMNEVAALVSRITSNKHNKNLWSKTSVLKLLATFHDPPVNLITNDPTSSLQVWEEQGALHQTPSPLGHQSYTICVDDVTGKLQENWQTKQGSKLTTNWSHTPNANMADHSDGPVLEAWKRG